MENKIRALRSEMGLSQEELARRCGVSRQTINAIENNKYDPTLTLAFHLAGVLGTTVDELFLGPGEKSCSLWNRWEAREMKHGTMSLRDRAAAWAFALFSAAALLAVAAQVFLGARPLQGMLPPLDQVTEFYVSPSHEDMVRFTVEENGLVQALGELRVAWRGPYQAIR